MKEVEESYLRAALGYAIGRVKFTPAKAAEGAPKKRGPYKKRLAEQA